LTVISLKQSKEGDEDQATDGSVLTKLACRRRKVGILGKFLKNATGRRESACGINAYGVGKREDRPWQEATS